MDACTVYFEVCFQRSRVDLSNMLDAIGPQQEGWMCGCALKRPTPNGMCSELFVRTDTFAPDLVVEDIDTAFFASRPEQDHCSP